MVRRRSEERGASVVEFAIVASLLLALLTGMADFGFALNAQRDAETAARTAARSAASAGERRLADYVVLRSVHSSYVENPGDLSWVTVYRIAPGATDSSPPAGCGRGSTGVAGVCNGYSQTQVWSLTTADFAAPDCAGDPDENWCPLDRAADETAGALIGVAIWADAGGVFGVGPNSGIVRSDAAFRMEILD